jgi:hypothetical protein
MQHHLYVPDFKTQVWQYTVVDEINLVERAYLGQLGPEALLYDPDTEQFTSAREYALLIGQIRGLPAVRQQGSPLSAGVYSAFTAPDIEKVLNQRMRQMVTVPAQLGGIAAVSGEALPTSQTVPLGANGQARAETSDRSVSFVTSQAPEGPTLTDEVVAKYVGQYRNSLRLQIAGLLALPFFGVGLPVMVYGWLRSSTILRLVGQTGMSLEVWNRFGRKQKPGFRNELLVLRTSYSLASLAFVAFVATGVWLARVSPRQSRLGTEIRQTGQGILGESAGGAIHASRGNLAEQQESRYSRASGSIR